MQTVATFMSQSLPVLAPLLTGSAGLAPQAVGPLSSLTTVATMAFMVLGVGWMTRVGPVRALQAGTAISALGLGVAALGGTPALVAASILLGVGYGPSNPAGARILAATAPARHRSLIFSIKQAGAPLGGVVAGLLVAPLAVWLGAGWALLAVLVVALLATVVIQPARTALDLERDPTRRTTFGRTTLIAPFQALRGRPGMSALTILALSFATTQGCLQAFVVTWLTTTRGFTLVEAGGVFAAIQTGSVLSRLVLGWAADRSGRPSATLIFQAFASGAVIIAFALLPAGTSQGAVLAVGVVTGALCAGWNGIFQAEIARLAAPGRIAEATAGSTTLCFVGYAVAPILFAWTVSVTGSWTIPQVATGVQLIIVAVLVAPRLWRA
ncbi:MFS transporter [Roseomonas sp. CCTCC AB2023176]|uniref:MFS transporter n=1 Tax=Roseomonas sp. CCTCC AB2023176 TaxID=3342640 RepID=UPI0035E2C82B